MKIPRLIKICNSDDLEDGDIIIYKENANNKDYDFAFLAKIVFKTMGRAGFRSYDEKFLKCIEILYQGSKVKFKDDELNEFKFDSGHLYLPVYKMDWWNLLGILND